MPIAPTDTDPDSTNAKALSAALSGAVSDEDQLAIAERVIATERAYLGSILFVAVIYKRATAIRRLIADPGTASNIKMPLSIAAQAGDVDILGIFAASPLATEDMLSEALCEAAKNGRVNAVKFLLSRADPRYQNQRPIIAAASQGHLEVIDVLLPFVPDESWLLSRHGSTFKPEAYAHIKAEVDARKLAAGTPSPIENDQKAKADKPKSGL